MAGITGTQAGGNPSTFEADGMFNGAVDAFPAGSQFTWTLGAPDSNITLGPDSGPNGNQVTVSVAAAETATSYVLNVSVQMPAVGGVTPTPLTGTATVPIIAAPPPVPTSVVINQVS